MVIIIPPLLDFRVSAYGHAPKQDDNSSAARAHDRYVHDLRNPLTMVMMATDTLRERFGYDGEILEECQKYAENIESALKQPESCSEETSKYVDKLFELANKVCGANSENKHAKGLYENAEFLKILLSNAPTSLGTIADKVHKRANYQYGSKEPRPLIRSANLDAIYSCDHRVAQTLYNLIKNAVKYGSGPVLVDAQKDEGYYQISVKNPGSLKDTSKLFQRGYTTGGTGLGLYLSKDQTESMGGDISAESSCDVVTFTVALPESLFSQRI